MGLFWKDTKTMDDLLLHGLKDVYYVSEEKAADKKLSTVALRKGVNRKAAS